MQTYGFDGVDIDLENGINATYMTQALRSSPQRRARPSSSRWLPDDRHAVDVERVLPDGPEREDILTVVNMQYTTAARCWAATARSTARARSTSMTASPGIQLQGRPSPRPQVGLGLPASTMRGRQRLTFSPPS